MTEIAELRTQLQDMRVEVAGLKAAHQVERRAWALGVSVIFLTVAAFWSVTSFYTIPKKASEAVKQKVPDAVARHLDAQVGKEFLENVAKVNDAAMQLESHEALGRIETLEKDAAQAIAGLAQVQESAIMYDDSIKIVHTASGLVVDVNSHDGSFRDHTNISLYSDINPMNQRFKFARN